MAIIYILRHELETDDLLTRFNVIGVFSSEEKAQEAIAQLEQDPEFKGHPGSFVIIPRTLDGTAWDTGFVTMP